jgi:hypothetical protein
MGYLIDILIGTGSRVVAGELSAHVKPFARWVINKGVDRLPVEVRDRFREEWLAHLDETPGMLRKLCHAIGCRWGAIKVGDVLRQERNRPAMQLDERTREFSCMLIAMIGEAGFDGVIRAAADAVADVEGRRPDHESVIARVVEEFRWHTRESWVRRRFRYWRLLSGWTLSAVFSRLRARV